MNINKIKKDDIVIIQRTVLPDEPATEAIDLFIWDEGRVLSVDLRRGRVEVFFISSARRQMARMTAEQREEWSKMDDARKKAFATYFVSTEDLELKV